MTFVPTEFSTFKKYGYFLYLCLTKSISYRTCGCFKSWDWILRRTFLVWELSTGYLNPYVTVRELCDQTPTKPIFSDYIYKTTIHVLLTLLSIKDTNHKKLSPQIPNLLQTIKFWFDTFSRTIQIKLNFNKPQNINLFPFTCNPNRWIFQ